MNYLLESKSDANRLTVKTRYSTDWKKVTELSTHRPFGIDFAHGCYHKKNPSGRIASSSLKLCSTQVPSPQLKTIFGTCFVFLIITVNGRVAILFCFKCLRFI